VARDPRYRPGDGRGNGSAEGTGTDRWEEQRRQLIDAFTRIGAERGFAKATIPAVTAEAGLPQRAFRSHFATKGHCLAAAYDAFLERLMEQVEEAASPGLDWPQRVKAAATAALMFVSETSTRARFFAVEAPSAGPLILDRHVTAVGRIVVLLRAGRRYHPEAAELPELTEPVLIGGVASLIGGLLLSEEDAGLLELESGLVEVLLTPYLGREGARKVAA
jgi:AcrR family transcriptional regulator